MNTTNANAHEAYRTARERLDEKLNALNRLIRLHDAREFRDHGNWCYTGDLNHVIEVIDEAVAFMGGSDGERAVRLMGLKEETK